MILDRESMVESMISAAPFECYSTNNLAEGKVINYGL